MAFSSLLKKISSGDDKVLPRLLADRQSISARENSDLIIVLAEKERWDNICKKKRGLDGLTESLRHSDLSGKAAGQF